MFSVDKFNLHAARDVGILTPDGLLVYCRLLSDTLRPALPVRRSGVKAGKRGFRILALRGGGPPGCRHLFPQAGPLRVQEGWRSGGGAPVIGYPSARTSCAALRGQSRKTWFPASRAARRRPSWPPAPFSPSRTTAGSGGVEVWRRGNSRGYAPWGSPPPDAHFKPRVSHVRFCASALPY